MKIVYEDMEHILRFDGGYVNELVVENKKMFFDMVKSAVEQSEGLSGKFTLSLFDRPVEFCRYADVTVQFAPFNVNRKSLLNKLYSALEKNAQLSENYLKTIELLSETERYILHISEGLPLQINCSKLNIGAVIKAVAPEIDETDQDIFDKIFNYMELVRELDRDRLFIMINMRTYFSDKEMECFAESVCMHDFKMLLIENSSFPLLKHTKRFTVDADLCEF